MAHQSTHKSHFVSEINNIKPTERDDNMIKNSCTTAITTLSLILLLCLPAHAASKKLTEDEKTFGTVVEAPGKSQEQIYIASKIWLAESFKSAKAVIEVDSKADGVILGNAIINYPCKGFSCLTYSEWKTPFTIKIEIKDQKFRVTYLNIRLSLPGQAGAYPASENPITSKSDMDKIKPELLKLTDELTAAVNKNEQKQEW